MAHLIPKFLESPPITLRAILLTTKETRIAASPVSTCGGDNHKMY